MLSAAPVVLTMEQSPAAEPPDFQHDPVMLEEILDAFDEAPSGVIADLTLGGAGHATATLDRRADIVVHGFDRDEIALASAGEQLAPYGARAVLHKTRFDMAAHLLSQATIPEVSGFLMDLGVSSPQLDVAERGFSYRADGPLDMRMDNGQTRTAADIVNNYAPGELLDVLRSYGDERHAGRIVDAIVAARPLTTTTALATLVADAIPAAARRKSTGHPAKRTFQALRIEVNDELSILGDTIDSMISLLAPGGVGLVLTYHSGEDRIAKDRMRTAIDAGALPGMPATSDFEWFFRGAKTASDSELERNPRARSARLRAIRKRKKP